LHKKVLTFFPLLNRLSLWLCDQSFLGRNTMQIPSICLISLESDKYDLFDYMENALLPDYDNNLILTFFSYDAFVEWHKQRHVKPQV